MGDAAPFARRLIRRARRLIAERLAVVNRRPLIVLGKEKSGTTAIAALLGEATGLTVTLDIPALFIDGLRPILRGEAELAELIARQRLAFSRDIIKEPNLTYIAGVKDSDTPAQAKKKVDDAKAKKICTKGICKAKKATKCHGC